MSALELADELEDEHDPWPRLPAAAELRRLHAENEAIHQAITDPENQPSQFGTVTFAMYEALEAQRDALLEALRAMRVKYGQYACRVCDLADAAIKKAEEA